MLRIVQATSEADYQQIQALIAEYVAWDGARTRQLEIYDTKAQRFSLSQKLDNDYYFTRMKFFSLFMERVLIQTQELHIATEELKWNNI